MTITPAQGNPGRAIAWEQAARRAEAGEVVHVTDDTGEHRFVVMTEEEFLAREEALEDAEHAAWQARNRDRLEADRALIRAGKLRGTPLEELRAEAEAELNQ